ncbi:MarR family winged helix-turn-helix transcriptional regulator [Streptomyces sp. V4-01]|uniref:MarR family winged helix-turn-helix transcriptional regulator n=1 Tax=Actinacidiphila polyblastidii TaxID=3110430 RepID=A0ABU7PAT6_9ACTN|nr:MarR family winged helix-turn-helix transcriptional regulator [Streptomyces sp. V4-01]
MNDATRAPEGAGPRAAPPTLTGLTTYLLSRTGKAARTAFAAELAGQGMRLWHMAVLAALADFGPHAQRELSVRLAIDPSDVVKVVDELAAPGWVERARDPADRRRVVISLTQPGRAALDGLTVRAGEVQDAVLAPLDPAERRQLHALLARVHAGLPAGPGAGRGRPSPP